MYAALARLVLREGDDELVQAQLARALAFYRSLNDRYSIAAQVANFGIELLQLQRREQAAPLLLQAAGLFEEIGLPQYAVQLRHMTGAALR